jgi:hypothetical protein
MKNLNVEGMGLKEMDSNEMRETTGGGLFAAICAVIAVGVCLWGAANFVKDVIINGERFNMEQW